MLMFAGHLGRTVAGMQCNVECSTGTGSYC